MRISLWPLRRMREDYLGFDREKQGLRRGIFDV